jgi:dihydroorotate dehydrogenase electron transfer subunit
MRNRKEKRCLKYLKLTNTKGNTKEKKGKRKRMKIESCLIVNKKILTESIVQFDIKIEYIHKAIPGQFIMAYFDKDLLPRPYSIANVNKNVLSIIFEIKGKGTYKHSLLNINDYIKILLPLGNGFPSFYNEKILLIGGGLGVAPLLFYINHYKNNSFELIYGARTAKNFVYPIDKSNYNANIKEIIGHPMPYLSTLIPKYNIIMTCGPQIMMDKINVLTKKHGKQLYISTEAHMGCGIGACLCCAINIDGEYKRVCKDGPIFKR